MALIGFNPGRVEVSVASSAKVTQQPRQITEAPGGLWPLQTKAFEMDDYRMMQGWPVPIPDYDIHCHSLVTARGEVFGVRDDNLSIKTGALMRWVADPNYYDPVALRWEPLVDDTGGQSVWETSVDYAPVLIDDYTYRVNNERFVEYALNFDSDTRNHMWADFGTSIGGSTGYTVIMVVSPNSVYGNDDDVVYNGLWCPGGPTPVGDTFEEPIPSIGWTALTFQGGWLYFQNHGKPRARAVPPAHRCTWPAASPRLSPPSTWGLGPVGSGLPHCPRVRTKTRSTTASCWAGPMETCCTLPTWRCSIWASTGSDSPPVGSGRSSPSSPAHTEAQIEDAHRLPERV
jgi:hypothetical protein